MKKNQMIAMTLVAAMLPLSACVTDPETGNRTISKAAIGGVGGALGGYLLGDLIGGRRDRTEKIVGAGIGALAGAARLLYGRTGKKAASANRWHWHQRHS